MLMQIYKLFYKIHYFIENISRYDYNNCAYSPISCESGADVALT